jgi:hypothetical protein
VPAALSARVWLNGWAITTRSICRRKSLMEAFCYGCEPETLGLRIAQ